MCPEMGLQLSIFFKIKIQNQAKTGLTGPIFLSNNYLKMGPFDGRFLMFNW